MADELDDEPQMISGVAWYKRKQWALLKPVADIHNSPADSIRRLGQAPLTIHF